MAVCLGISMLIELAYLFLAILPLICAVWRSFRHKESYTRYFTISFAFLLVSIVLQILRSSAWFYSSPVAVILLRILELAGLAFFTCFILFIILTIEKIPKASVPIHTIFNRFSIPNGQMQSSKQRKRITGEISTVLLNSHMWAAEY